MARVAAGYAVVTPGPTAFEGVTPIDNTLAGDAELPKAVILFLDASVGHAGHPRPLLREAKVVGSMA